MSTEQSDNGWLPIESAPKDGTVIDIANDLGRVSDVSWNPERRAFSKGIVGYVLATHWRPIPELPKKGIA